MNPVALYDTNPHTNATEAHRFNPYEFNGGTVLGIAGTDFCLMAADTRQSSYYEITSRYEPKTVKLTEKALMATSGFNGDFNALVKRLNQNLEWYKHAHDKEVSTGALAQMLSNTLYYKRFFPYYCFNLLGGIDEQGRGVLFSYDAIGSYDAVVSRTAGSGSSCMQPFIDNQIGFNQGINVQCSDVSLETAICVAKDAFNAVVERDTATGDYLEIFIIRKEGITMERHDLRKD